MSEYCWVEFDLWIKLFCVISYFWWKIKKAKKQKVVCFILVYVLFPWSSEFIPLLYMLFYENILYKNFEAAIETKGKFYTFRVKKQFIEKKILDPHFLALRSLRNDDVINFFYLFWGEEGWEGWGYIEKIFSPKCLLIKFT